MKRIAVVVLVLVSLLVPLRSQGLAQHHRRHYPHARLYRTQHHAHSGRPARRYYVVKKHRTKLQHAKIIGGTAKTGASVGGLVAGPPGAAAGAAAGAATGTAYDLKTRKKKVHK